MRITAKQQAARAQLDELVARIGANEPLPYPEWAFALHLFRLLREGYDIREEVGIAKRRGTRPTTREPQRWRALHCLKLCAEDPKTKRGIHALTVAKAWGTTAGVVQKDTTKWRDEMAPCVTVYTLRECEAAAKKLRQK